MIRRILSNALAIALLLGLGALAVLARSGGAALLSPVRTAAALAAPVAQGEVTDAAAPDAPATGISKWNAIAIPLDVRTSWAAAGYDFNAQGLAQSVGISSVTQVLQWNASLQGFDKWFPPYGYGFINGARVTTPFSLAVGGAYRLLLNDSNPSLAVFSMVDHVPAANTVKFALLGNVTACKWNEISIPLEQSGLTDATALANSMGGTTNVSQVLRWNAGMQGFDKWFPPYGYGFLNGARVTTPFSVQIGYPYFVCLKSDIASWP